MRKRFVTPDDHKNDPLPISEPLGRRVQDLKAGTRGHREGWYPPDDRGSELNDRYVNE